MRKENLGIRAFGSTETDTKVQDVVELDLKAKRVEIEAFVVHKIQDVANSYVELVKLCRICRVEYDHLCKLRSVNASDKGFCKWKFQWVPTASGNFKANRQYEGK